MKTLDIFEFIFYFILLCSLINLIFDYKSKMKSNPKVFFITKEGAEMPQKSTFGAAGYDFKVHSFKKIYKENNEEFSIDDPNIQLINLYPGERALISTGIRMKIPKGYELQIRSRSGLTLKQGLIVLNSPGTIDSDYLGDIGVILYNAGKMSQKVFIGDRICQGVFAKVEEPEFESTLTLSKTKRGNNGFGSTGRN